MDNEEIKQKVHQFLKENTYSDASEIADDTMIFKEGYLDSMGFITLITFLEENFKVKTEDRDFVEENFESIDAICNYVNQKLAVETQ
jgi:acyl carrier protein